MKINKQKFSFFYRGFFIIVCMMLLGILVAFKYLSYAQPQYQSIAKVRLADLQDGATGNNLFKNLDVFASKNELAAEIEVMKSQILIDKVVDKLHLDLEIHRIGKMRKQELLADRPFKITYTNQDVKILDVPFTVAVKDSLHYLVRSSRMQIDEIGRFGKPLKLSCGLTVLLSVNSEIVKFKGMGNLLDKFEFQISSKQSLYGKILKNLDVVSVDKDVAVVKIIYKSSVPEKAANFVNTLAELYIEDYIDFKYKTAEATSNFLDKQIAEVYAKLSNSEYNIRNYRDKKGIINLRQETETDLRKISQLKIQKTNVNMTLKAINDLDDYVQSGKDNFLELAPNYESFTDLLSTELIKKTKALQEERTDLLMTYNENHPLIQAVDEKIKHKNDYIIEAVNNTRKNLEIKYKQIDFDIEEAKKVFIGLPEKERVLTVMNRNFQLHEQSYIFLNQKRIEAEIAKSANIAFHRIITIAAASKAPIAPNRGIILIVFALVGAMGAMAIIYVVHLLKGKVNEVENIEKNSAIPIAIQTPRLRQDEIQVFFNKEVLSLQLKKIIDVGHTLTFTACKENQGAAFNAKHVAEVLQSKGVKVRKLNLGPVNSHLDGFEYVPYSSLSKMDAAELCNFLKSKPNEVTIIHNETLVENRILEIVMTLSDVNFFVMDSRKTLASEVDNVNHIQEKNGLSNLYFILNNAGYIPSIFAEVKNVLFIVKSWFFLKWNKYVA